MIQLTVVMWAMAALFGYIGFTRGWNKELIATSGIILGLFALNEFDDVIERMMITAPPSQQYFFRMIIFIIIVFFAYQTRAVVGEEASRSRSRRGGAEGRDHLQSSALGAIIGFVNGYLIWGSFWYFMHPDYPLSPNISAPLPGSASANFVNSLPLAVLGSGDGNLLAAAVIVLFIVVLIVI